MIRVSCQCSKAIADNEVVKLILILQIDHKAVISEAKKGSL